MKFPDLGNILSLKKIENIEKKKLKNNKNISNN
jgi:hypothetical protein